MRLPVSLALLLVPWPSNAWDTVPHQRITKAALDTMPKRPLDRLGTEAASLVEIYCIYPDLYEEMEHFGFVRRGPGPRSVAEIRQYCVRGDGRPVHGATGDREVDTGSLVFLFEHIVTNLSGNRPAEAAKYAGVLSHFIADSLSPPHAIDPEELLDLAGGVNVHSAIERSLPEFTLGDRAPHQAGTQVLTEIEAILDQVYAGAAQNRKDLPAMVKAVRSHDERALDGFRLRAGTRAAEILADALYLFFRTAEPAR